METNYNGKSMTNFKRGLSVSFKLKSNGKIWLRIMISCKCPRAKCAPILLMRYKDLKRISGLELGFLRSLKVRSDIAAGLRSVSKRLQTFCKISCL